MCAESVICWLLYEQSLNGVAVEHVIYPGEIIQHEIMSLARLFIVTLRQ